MDAVPPTSMQPPPDPRCPGLGTPRIYIRISEQAAIADLERIAMEGAQKVAAAKAKLGSASA
ncbi:MAG TPA: hypothetical protein VE093_26875 [Polyangiaceae bacterium]|jgi:hypothetical protein|nr:hypothetical protein [Polyangiaceae bacterium]